MSAELRDLAVRRAVRSCGDGGELCNETAAEVDQQDAEFEAKWSQAGASARTEALNESSRLDAGCLRSKVANTWKRRISVRQGEPDGQANQNVVRLNHASDSIHRLISSPSSPRRQAHCNDCWVRDRTSNIYSSDADGTKATWLAHDTRVATRVKLCWGPFLASSSAGSPATASGSSSWSCCVNQTVAPSSSPLSRCRRTSSASHHGNDDSE